MPDRLYLPYWEIAQRETMLQEVTVSEEDAAIIEVYDKEHLGYIHLMQNVKGSKYRPKLDGGVSGEDG